MIWLRSRTYADAFDDQITDYCGPGSAGDSPIGPGLVVRRFFSRGPHPVSIARFAVLSPTLQIRLPKRGSTGAGLFRFARGAESGASSPLFFPAPFHGSGVAPERKILDEVLATVCARARQFGLIEKHPQGVPFCRTLTDAACDRKHNPHLRRKKLGIAPIVIPLNPRRGPAPPTSRYCARMRPRFPRRIYGQRGQFNSAIFQKERLLGAARQAQTEHAQHRRWLLDVLFHNLTVIRPLLRRGFQQGISRCIPFHYLRLKEDAIENIEVWRIVDRPPGESRSRGSTSLCRSCLLKDTTRIWNVAGR